MVNDCLLLPPQNVKKSNYCKVKVPNEELLHHLWQVKVKDPAVLLGGTGKSGTVRANHMKSKMVIAWIKVDLDADV